MQIAVQTVNQEEEEAPPQPDEVKRVPPYGTQEWLYYWSHIDGVLPTPINVSITRSLRYSCPELRWYNFDVYPHKVKITNTGYTVVLGAKWKTERPYLEGGPFLEKHVLSQIHFHWGPNLFSGSEHTVDNRRYPGEMQVTFFRSEYLTQKEALRHENGVVMFCYMIKMCNKVYRLIVDSPREKYQYGVNPDDRLNWVLEGFPRIQEAQTFTRIGPYPMSRLLPMFYEDYFMYWGTLNNAHGESFIIRWLIPRTTLFASLEQMKEFRKLWDPWDEPNLGISRPLQEVGDRHVFFINAHWSQYNSLLPIPRILPELNYPRYEQPVYSPPITH